MYLPGRHEWCWTYLTSAIHPGVTHRTQRGPCALWRPGDRASSACSPTLMACLKQTCAIPVLLRGQRPLNPSMPYIRSMRMDPPVTLEERSAYIQPVGRVGLEPTTQGL